MPVYRSGQREFSNIMANTQPDGLNKRYNMEDSASANELPATHINPNEDAGSAPAYNLSADALPTTSPGQPMVPEALGGPPPGQSQKVMNTANIEAREPGPVEVPEYGAQEARAASTPGNQPGE